MPLSLAVANHYDHDHKERDQKTPQARQGVSSRYAQAAAIQVDQNEEKTPQARHGLSKPMPLSAAYVD